jgi:starch synthase
MRILFAASEGLPFSKTGGLADVIEALPKALVASGHDVAVVLPRYRGTQSKTEVLRGLAVPMGSSPRLVTIADGGVQNGVRYFFVDDPEYFDRDQLYGVAGRDYPDNAERFAEFSRACIEIAKRVWMSDVLHCHDWQSALVPVLLRSVYANDWVVGNLPVVFTIHNMGYQGLFPKDVMAKIGVPESLYRADALEYYGQVNYLKAGIVFSDYITTVSRKYAQEIQTAEFGLGLDGVVRGRADRLVGILNGVDYSAWSPENDSLIAARYSASDLSGKQICKKDLLAQFHLPAENLGRPVFGIVSRFVDQKGFDLIEQTANELLSQDLAIVALGTGEAKYEKMFRDLAQQHPAKLAVRVTYDNTLAHKIEAGADMFLMPSRYEPCGLNQIYSLRYGTVPVVRATGGLDDTIESFDPASGQGTGFKFQEYSGAALLGAVRQALAAFGNPAAWRRLQTNGMAKDFSWRVSAAEYARLYQSARRARIQGAAKTSN